MKWIWLFLLLISCGSGEKKITRQAAPQVPTKTNEVLSNGPNAIQIRLSSKKEALIEGVLVDESSLKSSLQKAKKRKGDTATVVINLRGDTEFGMFSAVHQTLELLLDEERDSVSWLRFNKGYEDLSETQKGIIKRKHHLRIIENMKR